MSSVRSGLSEVPSTMYMGQSEKGEHRVWRSFNKVLAWHSFVECLWVISVKQFIWDWLVLVDLCCHWKICLRVYISLLMSGLFEGAYPHIHRHCSRGISCEIYFYTFGASLCPINLIHSNFILSGTGSLCIYIHQAYIMVLYPLFSPRSNYWTPQDATPQ